MLSVLLLGDFSACQLTLSRALARMGHRVTLASEGCRWLRTPANFSTARPLPGPAGGALLFARMMLSPRLRGFDVVVLISPSFVQLRPNRLRAIFRRLRHQNGAVFLHAAGTDKAMMDYYLSDRCALRYTEFREPDGSPNPHNAFSLKENQLWQQGQIADFCEYVYDSVSGVTTALYEYHLPMVARLGHDRVAYTGLPVELPAETPAAVDFTDGHPMRFLLGRDRFRKAWKGTDRLEEALRAAVADSPRRATLDIVENMPYTQYLERLCTTDVLVDQLYSYTPALNALHAMARGRAAVSGGEPDFYAFIGESQLRPVLNAVPAPPDELYAQVRRWIDNPAAVATAAAQSREFVRCHHHPTLVAQRFINFWTSRL